MTVWQDELIRKIAALRTSLQHADAVNKNQFSRIDDLLRHVEQIITKKEDTSDRTLPEEVHEKLSDAVLSFKVEHPRLAESLRIIINDFNSAGI